MLAASSIPEEPKKTRRLKYNFVMLSGTLLLILAIGASIAFGAAQMKISIAWEAVFSFNPDITEHHIIRTLRFPRTVSDILVGCSLAIAGAIMQGTTRNPLADSGLMGISSGAGFAIALCLAFLPERTYGQTMLFSCLGAAAATVITYFIASLGKRGMTPQRLVLAGMSISMLFSAFSSYIAIKYHLGQSLAYWTAGGTANAKWDELIYAFPIFLIGVITAVILSPSVTVMSLGEEVAAGLGLRTGLIKGGATIIVLVLTGLSVTLVGPIGFVGLIVPHMVRHMIGVDYRYIIPASGLYGALFLVAADLLGRVINRPFETPLGVIFAVIGVPYFLYLSRRQRREFQ